MMRGEQMTMIIIPSLLLFSLLYLQSASILFHCIHIKRYMIERHSKRSVFEEGKKLKQSIHDKKLFKLGFKLKNAANITALTRIGGKCWLNFKQSQNLAIDSHQQS